MNGPSSITVGQMTALFGITFCLLFLSVAWNVFPLFVPLLSGACFGGWLAVSAGVPVRKVLRSAANGIGDTKKLIAIFLLIGALIPVWSVSGIIDHLIVHGLEWVPPRFLVLFAFLLATLVSMLLGTSVGTMGTVGVAVIGLAHAYGTPVAPVAGALVSGAFVGDRTSPLSGSAHLAAAMVGTPFFHSWRLLLRTLLPVWVACIVLYGSFAWLDPDPIPGKPELQVLESRLTGPDGSFSPLLWMPPLLVLLLSLLRVPVWANLVQAVLLGGLLGMVLYDHSLSYLFQVAWTGVERESVTVGGMWSMIQALWVIMSAGAFYGVLQATNILQTLGSRLTQRVKNRKKLMRRTGLFSLVTAVLTCNQTLSLMVPGKLMRKPYERLGLPAGQLTRTLSDTGMVAAGWIPWNLNALLCAAAIGVDVTQYMPYAYLPVLLPVSFFISIERMDSKSKTSGSEASIPSFPIR